MLEINGISTYYGNIQALHEVSLKINEGEIITLIGANGAGKTTTLLSVSGIVQPKQGEILFKGEPIHRMKPDKIVQMGICQVPEGRHIFPYLTVSENLDLGAFLRKDRDGIKKDIEQIYDLFPRLAERRHQQGGTLSGGEQQMLAIARALMSRPRILLLDEPSLGLAPIIVLEIFRIITDLNQQDGVTILLVEQNASLALKHATRGYVLVAGECAMSGSASDLLHDERMR
ncbi:MAG: ABC transporter ATP-binding protein, partial [Geovibrio sp.]|nr:ABC transporter ATP-binding protein [Geovibrio sp.]